MKSFLHDQSVPLAIGIVESYLNQTRSTQKKKGNTVTDQLRPQKILGKNTKRTI